MLPHKHNIELGLMVGGFVCMSSKWGLFPP